MAAAISLKTKPSPMTPITRVDQALPFAGRVVAYISDSDYFREGGYTLQSDPSLRFGYVKKNITQFPACKNGTIDLDADPFWENGLILARLLNREEFPSNYGTENRCFLDEALSLGYAEYIEACDSNLAAFEGTVNKVGSVARGITNSILEKNPISMRLASVSETSAIYQSIRDGNASLLYMFDKEKSSAPLKTHLEQLQSLCPNSPSTQSFNDSVSDQKENGELPPKPRIDSFTSISNLFGLSSRRINDSLPSPRWRDFEFSPKPQPSCLSKEKDLPHGRVPI